MVPGLETRWPVSVGAGWPHRCLPAWPGNLPAHPRRGFCAQSSPTAGLHPMLVRRRPRSRPGWFLNGPSLQTGLEDNPAFTVWQAVGRALPSPPLKPALRPCSTVKSFPKHHAGVLDQPRNGKAWNQIAQLGLLTRMFGRLSVLYTTATTSPTQPDWKTLAGSSALETCPGPSFPAPVAPARAN